MLNISRRTQRRITPRGGFICTAAAAIGIACGSATAIPEYNGVPPAGVTIDPNGDMLTVTAFNGAVLDWLSFNIASFETVHFDLPSAQARVLNNIAGTGESFIDGGLTSNGIIYLANPAGIIFGQNAMVDVGGIYAAAGTIEDFGSMVETFNLTGEVKNAGVIQGDQIHLLGNFVRNSGMLSSNGGIITMLAGDQVMLGEMGGNLLVKIDGRDILNAAPGINPTQIVNGNVGVENTGVIDAGNGRVVLGAGDMYGLAIKHTGEITGGEITVSSNNVVSMIDGDITGEILDFNAPIVIGSNDVTLSGSTLVSFSSTIDSVENQSNSLEVIGPDIRISGNVGVNDRLFNLDLHNNGDAGLITFGSGVVLTNGYQHYGMDVETNNSTHFISLGPGMGSADLIFDGNINGNTHLLRFSSNGATIWNGEVTAGQIQTGLAGIVIINGGLVNTISSQYYFNNVFLGADTVMKGQAIGFVGDVNSVDGEAWALDVESTGASGIFFVGDVGNINALSSLTTTSGGDTFIFGDVFTNEGIFLNNDVILMGEDNILDAGMGELFVAGLLEKTTLGDVMLISEDSIVLQQGASIEMGSLTFDGAADVEGDLFASDNISFLDLADLAGNIEAGLDINFNGPVTFDGNTDQMVLAGGLITALSTLQKINSGSLTLEAATLDLDDSVSVLGGSLVVNGDYNAAGDLIAAEDVTLNGTGVLDGDGDQRIDALTGALTTNGDLTKTTAGALTLAGDAGVDLNGDVDAQSGDLLVEDDLNAAGDLDASGSITFDGVVVMDGAGDQAVTAGDTLAAASTIEKTTAGDLALAGDLIDLQDAVSVDAGDLDIDGDVNLSGDVQLTATNIEVAGDINGPFTLDVDALEDLTFVGDMGTITALANLITDAGGVTVFGGSTINVTDSILLNTNTDIDVPDAATIYGIGDLELIAGEDIRMGQNHKMTVLGDLDMTAGDTVTVGDLNAFGIITIDAATIELLTREAGFVVNADGTITLDFGLDIIAEGFAFSVTPILIGGGDVFFATPTGDGDFNGTLSEFAFRTVEGDFTDALFFLNAITLDLAATGPTNANLATSQTNATVNPNTDPSAVVRPDAVIRALLAALGVNADAPNLAQAREATETGLDVSLDLPAVLNPNAGDYRISNSRLDRVQAEAMLASFLTLMTGQPDGAPTEGRIELATPGSPAAALGDAWAAHASAGGTVDTFESSLESAGDAAALEAIGRTRSVLGQLRQLGLSQRELAQANAALLDLVRPDGAPTSFDTIMTR